MLLYDDDQKALNLCFLPSLVVSPLVITTGTLGAMVVIVIVAVPLLGIGFTWSVVLCHFVTLQL